MSSLGQLLLDHGWISSSQLQKAVERQQQLGGRLGTCFLELGILGEDLLLQALSEQLGASVAPKEDLRDIAPEAIQLLPSETAIRSRAVPFRVSGGLVDIAMLDVGDLTMEDEISFIVGKRVRYHVATELRLVEALARYYGCSIPVRLSTLAQQLSRTQPEPLATGEAHIPRVERKKEAAASLRPDGPTKRRVIPALAREAPTSIPLTQEERVAFTQVRDGESNGKSTPQELFAMDLVHAETSTDIGRALLEVLAKHFVRILLFRVSGATHEVSGWLSDGPDIDSDWFLNYSSGLRQNTVFRDLEASGNPFLGKLENHPGHQALARCWGGRLDYECLLLPVFVRHHLVCVAYCDRSSLGLDNLDRKRIEKLVSKAAIAFERCILRHKLQST